MAGRLGAWMLAAVLLARVGAADTGEGPHAVLSDPERCGQCHVEVPGPQTPRPYRFQKDIVSLCLGCHQDKDLSSLHPVDIRPGRRVPADLPLDEHRTITCATCHDPHGPPEADDPYVPEPIARRLWSVLQGRKLHRTYFLRRRNDRGQLCLGCHERATLATQEFHVRAASILDRYAGSEACGRCHRDVYRAWRLTPHARMVRDARREPEAVLADFETDPPFPRRDVEYVIGSHWTQRYVVREKGGLYVKAPLWSIQKGEWDRSYWMDKPWTTYCAGCHTTGFEVGEEPRWAEIGIGCEACHGPGRAHAESGGAAPVVNPARLDRVRRDMICESCHTTGHDRTGQFRFPVGYLPGRDLTRYYKGLLPKPGQDNASFTGDESYEDRHRQWLFWVEHFMDARTLSCDICKNFRSTLAPRERARMSPAEYCLTCHRAGFPDTALHRAHLRGGVGCLRCHSPLREAGGAAYSVHDHKFVFLEPPVEPVGSPRQACSGCHPAGPEAKRR